MIGDQMTDEHFGNGNGGGNDNGNSAGDNDIEVLQKKLVRAQAAAEQNLQGWKRAQADFENYRKRKEAEGAEWINFGKQMAFAQILPVLDSLEQALLHAPDFQHSQQSEQQTNSDLSSDNGKYQNWKNGLTGIIKQIDSALSQMGIGKIEALGKKFDPYFHEAVREVEGSESGTVAEQYQTGFLLNGKVIRPAQVAIIKKDGNGNGNGSAVEDKTPVRSEESDLPGQE